MKIYQEVHIHLGETPESELLAIIEGFCNAVSDWQWLEDRTEKHPSIDGSPAGAVLLNQFDGLIRPVVYIRKMKQDVYRVSNVTPKNPSPTKITKDEYNVIAKRCGTDLRKHLRAQKIPITVEIQKTELGLNKIIRSKAAREAFERYLSQDPFSHHPCDDDRLHEFTCTVFRRKENVKFDDLERYLVEDLGWPSNLAKKCRSKVEIGWNVLGVCRRH